MVSPLIQKLNSLSELKGEEQAALDALCRSSVFHRAGRDLIREGDRPDHVLLLVEGWANRYYLTADGKRQIMAFLIPGDLCDPHVFILHEMDHSIGVISDARVAEIPKQKILGITERFPAIARAFWWSALVDEAILRQWLVNVGQRDAYQRIAHLLCELWRRMCQVGLATEGKFNMPLTQQQLGDTLGLTSVHVNRMLQRMRGEGLISTSSKHLTILDSERLQEIAGFDPRYLHMTRAS